MDQTKVTISLKGSLLRDEGPREGGRAPQQIFSRNTSVRKSSSREKLLSEENGLFLQNVLNQILKPKDQIK